MSEHALALDNLLKKASNDARLKFNRDKARAKRETEKQEATSLGITVKELKQKKAFDRASRPTAQEVENLKKILVVAPLLKSLKDEVEILLEKMNEDSKKVKITYVERHVWYLKKAINICKDWGKV